MNNNDFESDLPEDLKLGLYFIFVDGEIKKVGLWEWIQWFDDIENRRIDYTDISNEPNYPDGNYISTVCIGMGYAGSEGLPMLFETMVFGGKYDSCGWKYATYGEAKQGHWRIVDCIRRGEKPFVEFGEKPPFELFMEMLAPEESEDEREDS